MNRRDSYMSAIDTTLQAMSFAADGKKSRAVQVIFLLHDSPIHRVRDNVIVTIADQHARQALRPSVALHFMKCGYASPPHQLQRRHFGTALFMIHTSPSYIFVNNIGRQVCTVCQRRHMSIANIDLEICMTSLGNK
jgi:hypothetical protein